MSQQHRTSITFWQQREFVSWEFKHSPLQMLCNAHHPLCSPFPVLLSAAKLSAAKLSILLLAQPLGLLLLHPFSQGLNTHQQYGYAYQNLQEFLSGF